MKQRITYDSKIGNDIKTLGKEIFDLAQMDMNKNYLMHRGVSTYEHCVSVAYVALMRARKSSHPEKIDERSLVRGALLHDFFLYDWHTHVSWHRLHGYRHPRFAYNNACFYLHSKLNRKERDIIIHHMFPLTIIPPLSKEAWIVTFADKTCADFEHRYQKTIVDLSELFPNEILNRTQEIKLKKQAQFAEVQKKKA